MMRVGIGYFSADLIFMTVLGMKPFIIVHHMISLLGIWGTLWAAHSQVLVLPVYAFAEFTNPLRALCVITKIIASLNWPNSERANQLNELVFTPLFLVVFAVIRGVIFPLFTLQYFYCLIRYWSSKPAVAVPRLARVIGLACITALTIGSCVFILNHWSELGWPDTTVLV